VSLFIRTYAANLYYTELYPVVEVMQKYLTAAWHKMNPDCEIHGFCMRVVYVSVTNSVRDACYSGI